MKITIAGMGNAGTTIAADLAHKGHNITLLKTSNKLHNEHYEFVKNSKKIHVKDLDCEYISDIDNVTTDYEAAIKDADVIIIYIQTNYHEQFIKKIASYVHDGQTFIIEPGYLSTCYMLQNIDKDITIIEAESSPIDCRIIEPGKVQVLFKNVRNPFGVFPSSKENYAKHILDEMKYPYVIAQNVIEAALHNPNLIVHTVGAIFSIPRIEYTNGEYWMYKEVFTPHVWNIVESLDNEKMNVLGKMGCKRISYVEACKYRNSLKDERSALEVFFDYAINSSPKGPDVPDSRYITEDVPQGLVMLESLGKVFSVDTPVCTSLINIASSALHREFRKEGRTIEKLNKNIVENLLQINQAR